MKYSLTITILLLITRVSISQWTETNYEFTSPGTDYTKFQFAEHTWSGSHAILFNAYKSVTANGGLMTFGNTKYANNQGAYSGGAGGIFFTGNGGAMHFAISPAAGATGKDTNIDWGTSKMTIQRDGNVGIGTTTPSENLDVNGNINTSDMLIFDNDLGTTINGEIRGGHKAIAIKGNWDELEIKGRVIDWTGSNLHIGYANDHSSHFIEMGRNTSHISLLSGGGANETMRVASNGSVGIGTTTPSEKLEVNGTIRSKEVKVETNGWPDYVFEPEYELTSLEELEQFIQAEKHLPEIPSAEEIENEGLALGEMNRLLLQKVEELTLYTIQQQKLIEELYERIENE